MFNTALYIRLSREDGDKEESDSIGNQRKMLTEYVKKHEEMMLHDTYVDDGYSGTNFNRPAFKRMIEDVEDGTVNCIIVKDLSRFGRDYIDTGRYLERYFPDNDVRFIAVTDNIDSFKHSYDMLLPIKNVFNEQYARDISKKVQSSFKVKQTAGEFVGAFTSYGYKRSTADRHKLVIDEYPARIVRRIFQLYISGCGKLRIAHILNEENVLCPSEYKKVNGENYSNCNRLEKTSYWTYSTINNVLKNQMYIGNMVQGKTKRRMKGNAKPVSPDKWIVVKNTHEAIIDEAIWKKSQMLLTKRTRNLDLNNNMSIFAGYLVCGDCGRALAKKYSFYAGTKKYRYECGTYTRSGRAYCTPHSISHAVLEQIILEDLKVIIQNAENLRELIASQAKQISTSKQMSDSEIAKLNEELLSVQRKKKRIYQDYSEDMLTKSEYAAYRQDYLDKEKLLTTKIDVLSEKKQEDPDIDIFQNPWIERLLSMNSVEHLDRDIVIEMIHKIIVYENHRIKIIYNFSEELDTLFTLSHEACSQ
ncbi:MAG: recombinase family protein [Hespellia sp.]|nr:recombinase family protein [Hespellia sp.]